MITAVAEVPIEKRDSQSIRRILEFNVGAIVAHNRIRRESVQPQYWAEWDENFKDDLAFKSEICKRCIRELKKRGHSFN